MLLGKSVRQLDSPRYTRHGSACLKEDRGHEPEDGAAATHACFHLRCILLPTLRIRSLPHRSAQRCCWTSQDPYPVVPYASTHPPNNSLNMPLRSPCPSAAPLPNSPPAGPHPDVAAAITAGLLPALCNDTFRHAGRSGPALLLSSMQQQHGAWGCIAMFGPLPQIKTVVDSARLRVSVTLAAYLSDHVTQRRLEASVTSVRAEEAPRTATTVGVEKAVEAFVGGLAPVAALLDAHTLATLYRLAGLDSGMPNSSAANRSTGAASGLLSPGASEPPVAPSCSPSLSVSSIMAVMAAANAAEACPATTHQGARAAATAIPIATAITGAAIAGAGATTAAATAAESATGAGAATTTGDPLPSHDAAAAAAGAATAAESAAAAESSAAEGELAAASASAAGVTTPCVLLGPGAGPAHSPVGQLGHVVSYMAASLLPGVCLCLWGFPCGREAKRAVEGVPWLHGLQCAACWSVQWLLLLLRVALADTWGQQPQGMEPQHENGSGRAQEGQQGPGQG